MEIKQLKTFLTIAETGSFVKASKLLDYAQPTITTHIQMLESELNTKLFERLGHTVKLTQEGERLLYYAEHIVKYSKEATSSFASDGILTGKIVIGVNECFSIVRLPAVLGRFKSAYPEVDIDLQFGPTKWIQEQLQENLVDVTFFLTREINNPYLKTDILLPEPVSVVASPTHPLSERECIAIEDFEHMDLITTPSSCTYREMLESYMQENNTRPRTILETNNVQAILQLVINGLGVSILPRVVAQNEIALGKLIEVPWKYPFPPVFTQIAYHKDKWISPRIQAFLDQAKEAFFEQALQKIVCK